MNSQKNIDFFIIGCERSGSTMLCAMLSEHPELFAMNDCLIYKVFISNFIKQENEKLSVPALNTKVPFQVVFNYFHQLLRRYYAPNPVKPGWLTEYAHKLALNYQDVFECALDGELDLNTLFKMTYTKLIPDDQLDKKMYGEKTPIHTLNYPVLRKWYPDAKFITILRSPFSNIGSLTKRGMPIKKAVEYFLSYFKADILSETSNNTVVRYEDLILNTTQALSKTYSFLDAEEFESGGSYDYHIKKSYIGDKIDISRNDESRTILKPSHISYIKDRCSDLLERYYPDDPFLIRD